MRKFLAASALTVMLLFAGRAHAGYGYLCAVDYYTPSTYYGSAGGLGAYYTSGPSCTGSWLGFSQACSTGGTNCSLIHTENGLLTLFSNLRQACLANQKLFYGPGPEIYTLEFYSSGS